MVTLMNCGYSNMFFLHSSSLTASIPLLIFLWPLEGCELVMAMTDYIYMYTIAQHYVEHIWNKSPVLSGLWQKVVDFIL